MLPHGLKATTRDTANGGLFYHCECGNYYTKDKDEFEQHVKTGVIPPARGEFTPIELFPLEQGRPAMHCTECGAYVTMLKQVLHTKWHNKVANL